MWIFPWSLFLPAAVARGVEDAAHVAASICATTPGDTVDFYLDHAMREDVASYVRRVKFRARTIWLLSLFSAWTLLFFSISTNQEYYTFPVWPPLVMLIAGVVAGIEENSGAEGGRPALSTAWLTGAQAVFAAIGVAGSGGAGVGIVDFAQSAVRRRHRHAAGASRRGRLHAVDVAPVRFDRASRLRRCGCRRRWRRLLC